MQSFALHVFGDFIRILKLFFGKYNTVQYRFDVLFIAPALTRIFSKEMGLSGKRKNNNWEVKLVKPSCKSHPKLLHWIHVRTIKL